MSRARRRGEPERVDALLPRVLGELGLDAASAQVRLIRAWDTALGPTLAAVCRPEGLRRGVVRATVPDSAWMQRVQLETPRILAGLRDALGDQAPQALRLRLVDELRSPGSPGRRGSSG